MNPHPTLHLHLEFGPLIADFQGGEQQVAQVAAELSSTGLAVTVTVDDRVAPGMLQLPYPRLWDEPGQTDSGPTGEIDRTAATSDTKPRNALALQDLSVDRVGVWMARR